MATEQSIQKQAQNANGSSVEDKQKLIYATLNPSKNIKIYEYELKSKYEKNATKYSLILTDVSLHATDHYGKRRDIYLKDIRDAKFHTDATRKDYLNLVIANRFISRGPLFPVDRAVVNDEFIDIAGPTFYMARYGYTIKPI